MGRTLSQIFKDADAIIEKTAGATVRNDFEDLVASTEDEDIFKLAEAIRSSGHKKESEFPGFTRTEKLAYSKAILEVLVDSERLSKLQSFDKQANENGLSEQSKVLVKKATEVCKVDLLVQKASSSMPKRGQ
jgi:hypothetical protein